MMRKTIAALVLLCVACGKRGDPKPPVPIIPAPTGDLVAAQRAARIVLTWSYPALTTTGRSLTDIRRIDIYRYEEELPAAAVGRDPKTLMPGDVDPATQPLPIALFSPVPKLPAAHFAKLANRIASIEKENLAAATAGARLIFSDTPPLRAIDGRPVRLTYAVVTEGAMAKSQMSNLAVLVPLPVALPPDGLKAEARPQGVVLSWNEPKAAVGDGGAPIVSGYHVYRTRPGEALDELSRPIGALVKATTYTDVPAYAEHEYRVTAVAFEGPPLLQSDPSAPVRAAFRDLIAPPAPANVTALLETKLVRLLWEPVDAPDLAGYRVYRTEGIGHTNITEAGTIPISKQLLTETQFVDDGADLGIAYRYGVTALDKSGNESARAWTDWVVAPKTP